MPKMPKPKTALERMLDDIGGKFNVADQDEIMACDFVVCVLADLGLMLPDNVYDFCCKCDRKVQLRPDVPRGPKRICYDCIGRKGLKGHEAYISSYTAEWIEAALAARKAN